MLKNIIKKYKITHYIDNESIEKNNFKHKYGSFDIVYKLISKSGGDIFENGMFQILTFKKVDLWTNLITETYFDEFRNQLVCFAITWQGCLLAVNEDNTSIFLFDPATCEYFELEETSLEDFFKTVFFEVEDELIYVEGFRNSLQFLKLNILDSEKSIAHKTSLFLGGEDVLENLEVIDSEVLWDMQIQIAEGLNEIPN